VPHRVLIASCDADLSAAYAAALSDCGCDVERVTTGLDCLARYRAWHPEVMLVTRDLLWGSGPDVLAVIHDEESDPASAVVMTDDTAQARAVPVSTAEDPWRGGASKPVRSSWIPKARVEPALRRLMAGRANRSGEAWRWTAPVQSFPARGRRSSGGRRPTLGYRLGRPRTSPPTPVSPRRRQTAPQPRSARRPPPGAWDSPFRHGSPPAGHVTELHLENRATWRPGTA